MAVTALDQEYDLLVKEGIAKGEIQVRVDEPDLRGAPRFQMHQRHLSVRVEPQLSVVDLSALGIALLSEYPFDCGETLHLVLQNTLVVQAQVMGCELVETDPMILEARYRVQCRFLDATHGKQLLVLMKELERGTATQIVN